jgi:uncharacterized cupin superfamily protein
MKPTHPVFAELAPDPLAPDQILAGEAATADLTLAESAEGDATVGLWSCTPGEFSDEEVRESFLVISGRATLRYEDGTTHELVPGTVHEFAGGERTVWTVHEKLVKAYWIADC